VIVSLEIGGAMILSQAIGQWLRRNGANGLIFPSARSNTFCRVNDGQHTEWGGWNLVVYAGAEPPVEENLFGRMSVWRDKDHNHIHVDYTADGADRGSFSIRGAREFNLLQFDLNKQLACGIRKHPVGDLLGVTNWRLSQSVNEMLDLESKEQTLWYQDIDYTRFVTWLEQRWREIPKSW
jgi:hypothetical protein